MPTTTNYIWDDENLLAETDGSNVVQTVYTGRCHPKTRRWLGGLGNLTGPVTINPGNGNLVVELPLPASGPFDGVGLLTYNSRAASQSTAFGFGWADVFNPTVSSVDSTAADLVRGDGSSFRYTGKDGSGKYLPPDAAGAALVQNGDNTWTETRADGFQLKYDTGGALKNFLNPAGSRWTVARTSGERHDPALGRNAG